jgi:O-antigen/teichoic acid export membrane protein
MMAMVVCGLAVGGLEALIGWVIPFVFGPEFQGAVPISRVLLVSGLLLGVRRALADGARGAGMPGVTTFAEVVCLAALVPALLIGVQHGPQAVAVLSAGAYALSLVCLTVLVWRGFHRERVHSLKPMPLAGSESAREDKWRLEVTE